MRYLNAALAAIGVVGLCATFVFTQTIAGSAATAVIQAAPKALALSGTIAGYDGKANTLTVKAQSGEQTVYLGTHTRVHEGSKTLKASELASLTGRSVKVRYTESGGKMTAETVAVGPAATR